MPNQRGPAAGPTAEVAVETRAELRQWLVEHADASPGIWLVTWKKATGRPAPSYDDVVEEGLCFGWIDSTNRTLDAERSALRFGPRRRRSGWARTNKVRVERLEAQGLMTDAGRAVIDRAKADGSWTLLDDVEDLAVPDDLAQALAGRGQAAQNFEAFPRSARRAVLAWIAQARRPETRRRRVEEAAVRAAQNERAGPAAPARPKGTR